MNSGGFASGAAFAKAARKSIDPDAAGGANAPIAIGDDDEVSDECIGKQRLVRAPLSGHNREPRS
jgi:hypothetical protein